MSTTDSRYPDWSIWDDGPLAGDASDGRGTYVDIHQDATAPEVRIEHTTIYNCSTWATVPPFVLAAQLRRLGWTVTEPGGGS